MSIKIIIWPARAQRIVAIILITHSQTGNILSKLSPSALRGSTFLGNFLHLPPASRFVAAMKLLPFWSRPTLLAPVSNGNQSAFGATLRAPDQRVSIVGWIQGLSDYQAEFSRNIHIYAIKKDQQLQIKYCFCA